MIKLWSELPAARAAEVGADVATAAWVGFWGWLAWQLYTFLRSFAEAGRVIREGGRNLDTAGVELGRALAGVPVVGASLRDASASVFAQAGRPFIDFGTDLEGFILALSAIVAIAFVAIPLIPWLSRYVPWRLDRLGRLRAAHRVIRRAHDLSDPVVERLLASRALHRLSYEALLEYSPDPFGDFAGGRHDRLARAELASVGLRGLR
ncbi:MAG TPA: hypothetical protein VGQ47_00015 [Candidatus Limnocylindrales bacterium]|jgi:hypothetical protein|nr:hypothetical protein [Candidatus Limnocylindrales bacterium]